MCQVQKCQMGTNLIMANPSSEIIAPWLTRTWYRNSSCPQDIFTLSRPQFASYMPYLVLRKYAIWLKKYTEYINNWIYWTSDCHHKNDPTVLKLIAFIIFSLQIVLKRLEYKNFKNIRKKIPKESIFQCSIFRIFKELWSHGEECWGMFCNLLTIR